MAASTPDPAPVVAPKPPRVRNGLPSLHAIIGAVPAISLGFGFWLLIFHKVPTDNKEMVLAIGSGLLGYLTRDAQARGSKDAPEA